MLCVVIPSVFSDLQPLHRVLDLAFFFSNMCDTSTKSNVCQCEVGRELTEDFCLCFQGIVAFSDSECCRRRWFDNCGLDRGEMELEEEV